MDDLKELSRTSAREQVARILEEESDRGALTNRLAALLEQACRNGEPHQGYRNYETFSVAVVLDNDEPWHRHIREQVAASERSSEPALELGRRVRGLLEAHPSTLPRELRESARSVREQLLEAALETVDWLELGQAWAENAREGANGY